MGCGQKGRRKKKKSLNRGLGDIVLGRCGSEWTKNIGEVEQDSQREG